MTGVARRDVAPYAGEVRPRVCGCRQPAVVMSTHRSAERAVAVMAGYWNVYLAFYGDQLVWLEFTVTDTRDGRLVWRNGRHVKEETHGQRQSA